MTLGRGALLHARNSAESLINVKTPRVRIKPRLVLVILLVILACVNLVRMHAAPCNVKYKIAQCLCGHFYFLRFYAAPHTARFGDS